MFYKDIILNWYGYNYIFLNYIKEEEIDKFIIILEN